MTLVVLALSLLCPGASGFGWLTPPTSTRSVVTNNLRPVAVAPKKPSTRPAAARPQVYQITTQSGTPELQDDGLPRSRTPLARVAIVDHPDADGIVKPTKRITKRVIVVLPAKEKKLASMQATSTSRLVPKAAAVAPDPKLYEHEYWYDPRIHNWGNVGFGGFVHALFAPLATFAIDALSYGGVDVRKRIKAYIPQEASVLDLCCGTGFSSAFGATGIDTSREMLSVARLRRPDCKFEFGNAETYGETDSYDIVTMMFATHEMPAIGRRRVLRNAMRVAKKTVIVADIDPDFHDTLRQKPMEGATFLTGEPYVLNYLDSMDNDVLSCAPVRIGTHTWKVTRETILPKHVVMWRLDRVD